MLVYEYKLDGKSQQFQAIEEAIRVVQFIRNTCLRLWMDSERVGENDLEIGSFAHPLGAHRRFQVCLPFL